MSFEEVNSQKLAMRDLEEEEEILPAEEWDQCWDRASSWEDRDALCPTTFGHHMKCARIGYDDRFYGCVWNHCCILDPGDVIAIAREQAERAAHNALVRAQEAAQTVQGAALSAGEAVVNKLQEVGSNLLKEVENRVKKFVKKSINAVWDATIGALIKKKLSEMTHAM